MQTVWRLSELLSVTGGELIANMKTGDIQIAAVGPGDNRQAQP